jgi:hypothetical protein
VAESALLEAIDSTPDATKLVKSRVFMVHLPAPNYTAIRV